jgi:hypothetical protein
MGALGRAGPHTAIPVDPNSIDTGPPEPTGPSVHSLADRRDQTKTPKAPNKHTPSPTRAYLARALRGQRGRRQEQGGDEAGEGLLALLGHLCHLVLGGRGHLEAAAGLGRRGHEAQGGLQAEEEDGDGEEDLHGCCGFGGAGGCCVCVSGEWGAGGSAPKVLGLLLLCA